MPLRNRQRNKRVTIVALSLGIIGLSLISMCRNLRAGRPRYDASLDDCLGEILADVAAKSLHDRGNVLVVEDVTFPNGSPNPVSEAHVNGFRRGLSRHPEVKLLAVEQPARGTMHHEISGVPSREFLRVIQAHPDAEAIVSFVGIPQFLLQPEEIQPEKLPRLVALTDHLGGIDWVGLVRSGKLSALAMRRGGSIAKSPASERGDCAARVTGAYSIVTTENVDVVARDW